MDEHAERLPNDSSKGGKRELYPLATFGGRARAVWRPAAFPRFVRGSPGGLRLPLFVRGGIAVTDVRSCAVVSRADIGQDYQPPLWKRRFHNGPPAPRSATWSCSRPGRNRASHKRTDVTEPMIPKRLPARAGPSFLHYAQEYAPFGNGVSKRAAMVFLCRVGGVPSFARSEVPRWEAHGVNMARVHVVANQKGGVGKTTLAVNLAATLADVRGSSIDQPPVLVVSTDPQASTVWWADRVGDEQLPFDFVQAHEHPRQLARLRELDQYTEVIVDTPGSLEQGHILESVLDNVTEDDGEVIVPVPPEPLAFDATTRTVEDVLKKNGVRFRVVINNWDPRDGKADLEETRAYIQAQEWPAANVPIRRYKIHARASLEGHVVTQYPRNRVALEARQDFSRLALELGMGGN